MYEIFIVKVGSTNYLKGAEKMCQKLKKGQRTNLTQEFDVLNKLSFVFSCNDNSILPKLDLSAFLLDSNEKVQDEKHFVFYNNPIALDGAVMLHDGHNDKLNHCNDKSICIDLSKIPDSISKVVFTISIYNDSNQKCLNLKGAYIKLVNTDTQNDLLHFDTDSFSNENVAIVCELYKLNNYWKFYAANIGMKIGLSGLCERYGIDVDDTPDLHISQLPNILTEYSTDLDDFFGNSNKLKLSFEYSSSLMDVDFCVKLEDINQRFLRKSDFIYRNNPSAREGAILYRKDSNGTQNIIIDFSKLPPYITRINLMLWKVNPENDMYTLNKVKNACIKIHSNIEGVKPLIHNIHMFGIARFPASIFKKGSKLSYSTDSGRFSTSKNIDAFFSSPIIVDSATDKGLEASDIIPERNCRRITSNEYTYTDCNSIRQIRFWENLNKAYSISSIKYPAYQGIEIANFNDKDIGGSDFSRVKTMKSKNIKKAKTAYGLVYPEEFDTNNLKPGSIDYAGDYRLVKDFQWSYIKNNNFLSIKFPKHFDIENADFSGKSIYNCDFSLVTGFRWKHMLNSIDFRYLVFPMDFDIENANFNGRDLNYIDFSRVNGLKWHHICLSDPCEITQTPDGITGMKFAEDFDTEGFQVWNQEFSYEDFMFYFLAQADFSKVKGLRWSDLKNISYLEDFKFPKEFDIENADFKSMYSISGCDFSRVKSLYWDQIKNCENIFRIKYPMNFDINNANFDEMAIYGSDFSNVSGLTWDNIRKKHFIFDIVYPSTFDIDNADYEDSCIAGSDFSRVSDLRWKHIKSAFRHNFSGIIFPSTFDIGNADFTDADISYCDFSRVLSLKWEHIKNASNISGIKYPPAFDIENADFSERNISGSDFSLLTP